MTNREPEVGMVEGLLRLQVLWSPHVCLQEPQGWRHMPGPPTIDSCPYVPMLKARQRRRCPAATRADAWAQMPAFKTIQEHQHGPSYWKWCDKILKLGLT
jgi:hypothetical protein